MKFKYLFILIIVLFAGVLFYTNPSDSVHKTFIKDKFLVILNQKIDEELEKTKDPNLKLFGNLGRNFFPVLGDEMIDNLINDRVKRKNYYLFSTTQILYKDHWQTIGFGILDKVYLFPKVEDELKKLDLKSQAFKYLGK